MILSAKRFCFAEMVVSPLAFVNVSSAYVNYTLACQWFSRIEVILDPGFLSKNKSRTLIQLG